MEPSLPRPCASSNQILPRAGWMRVLLALFFWMSTIQAWAQGPWVLAVQTGNRKLDRAVYAEALKALAPHLPLWNGDGPPPNQVAEIWVAAPTDSDPGPFSLQPPNGIDWYCMAQGANPPLANEATLADLLRRPQLRLELRLWRPGMEVPETYRLNLGQNIFTHQEPEQLVGRLSQEWMKRLTTLFVANHAKETPRFFQAMLRGKRLILDGSRCEGWEFTVKDTVLRYEVPQCDRKGPPAFEACIHWFSADEFLLVESPGKSATPNRAPRLWVFKVEAPSDSAVTLKERWLGWGEGKESISTYWVAP